MTDLQEEAKQIVLKELETQGIISNMKAQLKSSVLKIIQKQKEQIQQATEFDYMTPLYRQAKSREVMLMCHLIKDFLKYYKMDYTLPIFENESNVKETITKETLLKEISKKPEQTTTSPSSLFYESDKIEDEKNKPILIQMLLDYQRKINKVEELTQNIENMQKNNITNNNNNNNTNSGGYGKKTLSPITFGVNSSNTNDEVKFSNINISDVYKKPPPKEITAEDILNKDKKEENTKIESVNDKVYEIEGNKDNDDFDNDNEFQDEILEDIEIEQPKKGDNNNITENSKDISSSAVTLGIDSSVKSNMLNEFDHYENVQIP